MSTRRKRALDALYIILQATAGMAATSITRERAAPVAEAECPACDLSPESEPDPQAIGDGADRRYMLVAFKFYTAGASAYSLADPLLAQLHSALYVDPTLGGIITTIFPASTDFARDDAAQIIGRTTVRYTIVYTTRRRDINAKA